MTAQNPTPSGYWNAVHALKMAQGTIKTGLEVAEAYRQKFPSEASLADNGIHAGAHEVCVLCHRLGREAGLLDLGPGYEPNTFHGPEDGVRGMTKNHGVLGPPGTPPRRVEDAVKPYDLCRAWAAAAGWLSDLVNDEAAMIALISSTGRERAEAVRLVVEVFILASSVLEDELPASG